MKAKFFLLLIFVSLLFISCQQRETIIILNIDRVFEEFDMQKELRQSVDQFISHEKGRSDSLTSVVNRMADELENMEQVPADKMSLYRELFKRSSQEQVRFEEEKQKMVEEYDQMIIQRINLNIPKFAEKTGADIIISMGGNYSAALFVSPEKDLSEDFIKFINAEYHDAL